MTGSGVVRARKAMNLVNSNKDIDEIIRIIVSLETSDVLLDGVTETIKHEIKQQEGEFPGMLFGNLVSSMSGNMLNKKEVKKELKKRTETGVLRTRKDIERAGK